MRKRLHTDEEIRVAQDRIAKSAINKRFEEERVDDILLVIDYLELHTTKAISEKFDCSLSMARDRYSNGLSIIMPAISDIKLTSDRAAILMNALGVDRHNALIINELISRREKREMKRR